MREVRLVSGTIGLKLTSNPRACTLKSHSILLVNKTLLTYKSQAGKKKEASEVRRPGVGPSPATH